MGSLDDTAGIRAVSRPGEEKMGFLPSLEDSLRADLSDRVLLLHGLSGWPSPHGSYALCEVSLSSDGEQAGNFGSEKEVQFVIKAIPGAFSQSAWSRSEDAVRLRNAMDECQIASAGSNETLFPDAEGFEGEAVSDLSDGVQKLENRSGLKETQQGAFGLSNEPPSERTNDFQDVFAAQADTGIALDKLAVVAPTASICPASYESLLAIIRGLQGRGVSGFEEQKRFKSGLSRNDLPEEDMAEGVSKLDDQQGCNGSKVSNGLGSQHPNLAPILGLLQGEAYLYVIYPAVGFTLQSLLYFSPAALGDDLHIRFLIFQILAAVAYSHKHGVIHGDLRPANILLKENLWCLVTGFLATPKKVAKGSFDFVSRLSCSTQGDSHAVSKTINDRPERSLTGFYSDWRYVLKGWWAGQVSNYDYLLMLNVLAGRRWADPCFHTVMPWVIDFSVNPSQDSDNGWRDLTKSKWRLAKGDEQLDFTYASAEMPHHVSDECLSELAVCIYKARRLPLVVLRRVVRSVYEPNEYPINMHRLYHWTPDECIPEFYSDAHIVESIHPGMNNLAVPGWAKDAADFTSLHRAALESDRVSRQLHHWIDLTFGYKLSGEAAICAKNVTLSTVGPTVARSSGRRQLFSQPHPRRQHCKSTDVVNNLDKDFFLDTTGQRLNVSYKGTNTFGGEGSFATPLTHTGLQFTRQFQEHDILQLEPFSCLDSLEELMLFSESARHLSPCYNVQSVRKASSKMADRREDKWNRESLRMVTLSPKTGQGTHNQQLAPYNLDIFKFATSNKPGQFRTLVERLREEEEDGDDILQSLGCIHKTSEYSEQRSCESEDIFALGCVIAELYLRRPLLDQNSTLAYKAQGIVPDLVEDLPPNVRSLVKSTLQAELSRRPAASDLLGSSFFPWTIRAAYFFLAPLQLLNVRRDQLRYLAWMARDGAFMSMGPVAAEMCAPSVLSMLVPPYQEIDASAVTSLITKLLQALKPHASKRLLVPVVQRLLQSQQSPSLNLALLQLSFVRELWKAVGTGVYLQFIHPHVLGNLRRAPLLGQATAASKLLVSMCVNLGVAITLHQTVTPILQAFGRDITANHIEVIFGIGERMGEQLVVKHLLPPLQSIIESNASLIVTEGSIAVHSWRLLAMVDAMAVLDRLRNILRPGVVLRELLQEPRNVYVKVLLQRTLKPNLLQCAAKALLLVCNQVEPEAVVSYVLPQLKGLFDGLAFAGKLEGGLENGAINMKFSTRSNIRKLPAIGSQENLASQDKSQLFSTSGTRSGGSSAVTFTERTRIEDDILLVHILYPGLATLIGIERLRQGLTTWLLLEQALLKHYNWKWEGSEILQPTALEQNFPTETSHETVNPASLLIDGVGWSSPVSQVSKLGKTHSYRRTTEISTEKFQTVTDDDVGEHEGPWSWVSTGALWDAEAFARVGAKDDNTWGLRSTILHSWRAHTGLIRSTNVSEDENTVFTAGAGPRGGSVVREWRLAGQECVMEYTGHEEVVNDVCILPGSGRIASCDGTIHIWNAHTGKRLAIFDEISASSASASSSSGASVLGATPGEIGKFQNEPLSGNGATMSNHNLTAAWAGGGLYSCMHYMEAEERLLGGMVNGSLRFIDIERKRQLFLWRFGRTESTFSSFVSAIATSGQGESAEGRKYALRSSWIAVGFGSGRCQLVDSNSGAVVGQWRAHDGFITKMYALEERYLISSSLDKTISLWDLRRGTSPERLQVFRGHKHGITGFALKGCDLLSAAGSKIGLSCLSKSAIQGEESQVIQPRKLYSEERGNRSLSNISTIAVLPFSRLFLVGTDDGHVKICS